jgi:hypothetical protein
MKKITKAWLKKHDACRDARKLFAELYPTGIEVCWKCFREAQEKGLDVAWLIDFISQTPFLKIQRRVKTYSIRKFPALEERFNCEWTVLVLPSQALKILEKAFLEESFDPDSVIP